MLDRLPARNGFATADRYYADARSENFATPLAQAQLGAALAYYGEQPRADARVYDHSH